MRPAYSISKEDAMNRKLLIGLGALLVVIVAGAAYAMGHGGRGRMMKHMVSAHIEEMEDYIEATPEQRATIEASKETIFKALEGTMKARQQTHAQVVQLLTAKDLDTKDLYALADQHAQAIQAMAKVIVPEIKKVHDALTPAQLTKLAEKAKQMHEHHQGGFGGPGE
jgi:Spy/CpxP family protein refolding chaperone